MPEASFPLWSALPFAGLLLTLGVMSFIAANFPHSTLCKIWESNRNKLLIALGWSIPVILLAASRGNWHPLAESVQDYIAFIVLLFSLFTISGGVYLSGDIRATPFNNVLFLGGGAVLSNIVGTTGASVLLIRPFLRTNSERKVTAHLPVFFIFAVSNIGGCLLPIGDPPLFLGYLKGVPFFWTLQLWMPWLAALVLLLGIFYWMDRRACARETAESMARDIAHVEPIRMHGKPNLILLGGVLAAVIFITPGRLAEWGWNRGIASYSREILMLGLTGISFLLTPLHSHARKENQFTFGPIQEVAYLFIGIFITMIPALALLREHSAQFGLAQPWHFFWASGTLSSVLDNAPTYLTFLAAAQGLTAADPSLFPPSPELSHLNVSGPLLAGVSLGSVFMGSMTYIGNGPNFMVKAIADEWGYKTPDFFNYIIRYSVPVLIPIFVILSLLFLQ